MKELSLMLNKIDDAYRDFINAVIAYAEKKPSREKAVMDYLESHPNVTASDVVKFISDQPDFLEDIAYMEAV